MGIKPMNRTFERVVSSWLILSLAIIFIFRSFLHSLPLTDTIYTLPENLFEFSAGFAYISAGERFRKERATLGFGVRDDTSLSYSIEYLHREDEGGGSSLGDSFLRLWYYAGEFAQDRICWGIAGIVRVPTGPSMYASQRWQPVASGIHELKLGPVFQTSIANFFIHANLFYTFRQAEGENFYGGFKLKPFDRESYTGVLGFNPWHEGAFADKNRLKNDYASIAASLLTSRFFPFIFYAEFYYSHRVASRTTENDMIQVEGAGVNPLFVGAGIRYFISYSSYAELFGIARPGADDTYIRWIVGLSVSAVF